MLAGWLGPGGGGGIVAIRDIARTLCGPKVAQDLCPHGKWSPFSTYFWETFGILLTKFPRRLFNSGVWSRIKNKTSMFADFPQISQTLEIQVSKTLTPTDCRTLLWQLMLPPGGGGGVEGYW
jgi:hypothetical protein